MERTINLDSALDALTDYCENKCVIREDAWCPDCQYEAFKDVLKALPSAHSEIVRCSDCMYADSYNHCKLVEWWNVSNDFCSRGERKKEEQDEQKN